MLSSPRKVVAQGWPTGAGRDWGRRPTPQSGSQLLIFPSDSNRQRPMLRVDVPWTRKLSRWLVLLERAAACCFGADLGADTLDGDDDEHRNQAHPIAAHLDRPSTPDSSLTNFSIDLNIDCSCSPGDGHLPCAPIETRKAYSRFPSGSFEALLAAICSNGQLRVHVSLDHCRAEERPDQLPRFCARILELY